MDSSGSMTTIQYLQQKRFIQHLTRKFKIARDGTRVGIIVYSTRASIAISLKSYFTWRGFARAVSRIRFERGDTRIDLALKSAREIFKTSRGSREGVPKILIILTDGQQTMVRGEVAMLDRITLPLRRMKVKVYAIGIGRYSLIFCLLSFVSYYFLWKQRRI